ncbi:MAG: LacI family transcriptional regulator [Oscillospiraceae bacterium]|nr:LacI family transcriptional regulator [Oscillospiraceae bacterium]
MAEPFARDLRDRPATIKDVAKLANVSISTVSRVVNQTGGVSDELTLRIEGAISALRYRSNGVARALRVNATRLLGFIVPSVANPTFGALAQSVEQTANERGYSTILCNSGGSVDNEVRYLRLLIKQQADGILFNSMGIYDQRLANLTNSGIPVVVVGRKIPGLPTTNVTTNNRQGAFDAVSYLINKGHRRIAFVFGVYESATALEDRYDGYKDALRQYRVPFDERLVVKVPNVLDSAEEAARRLIDSGVAFDGVFASNDLIALSVIKNLERMGFRVPNDVCVMGYDMIPFSQMRYPALSTVDSHLDQLGREATIQLIGLAEGMADNHSETVVKSEIVLGGTA